MPKTRRRNDFENRTNRFKYLEAGRYHQAVADEGVYLLYRRGPKKSVWYMRARGGKQRAIGLADDYQDADGETVLTYFQAIQQAIKKANIAAETKQAPEPRRGHKIGHAAEEYLAYKFARGVKSYREIKRVLDTDILPTWKDVPLKLATVRAVDAWITELVKSPCRTRSGKALPIDNSIEGRRRRRATAQKKYNVLRAVLNFAYAQHMIDVPIWRGVKDLENIDPPEDEFPTLAECKRLARRAPAEFRPIVEATFLTGAAYGELTAMRVSEYRADTGHAVVFNSKRRNRAIPLTTDGVALFDDMTAGKGRDELIFTHKDGSAWRKSEQKRPMSEANEKAKLDPPITLTRLRKAYGSLLLNAGVSLEVVSKAMGHSDPSITKRHYSRLLQSTIDEQIRAALPSLGVKRRKVARIA